jgi:hypothetical protein
VSRLFRALGYAALGALLLRWFASGSTVLTPWYPGLAVAVMGVAFGLERLAATAGRSRSAPIGLVFGVAAAVVAAALYGAPWQSVGHGLATLAAAAVVVPLVGLVLEAYPGEDGKAHLASGVVGLCALAPLAVHVLPGWLHPITHWNPLFWVQHAFLLLYRTPAELEASGIRFPASFEWEYTVVPFAEAAFFGWLLLRRIRRRAELAG